MDQKTAPLSLLLFVLSLLSACGQGGSPGMPAPPSATSTQRSVPPPPGDSVSTRFRPPAGFERVSAPANSFAAYLRHLPLKPEGVPVLLFNGEKKARQDVHAAVVDMDTGDRDLQQCADAIMRLRAEFLFGEKRYSDIRFNFTNGFPAEYAKWREGQRIRVEGNRCTWYGTGRLSTSYEDFRKYLDLVFMYAGTLSLSKELPARKLEEMEIGDLFIQGGSPGHAVLVVDLAVNPATGDKVFMLAQSYMPAQEIHVLKNPDDPSLSPWYSLDFGEKLRTPEWTFLKTDLKGF